MWLLPSRLAASFSFQLSHLLLSRHLLLQVSIYRRLSIHPTNSILRNYSLPSVSCKIPCHGLYSDVEHEVAGQTIGLDTPGMAHLMKEYQAYKRGNLHDPVPYLKGWSFEPCHLQQLIINGDFLNLNLSTNKRSSDIHRKFQNLKLSLGRL